MAVDAVAHGFESVSSKAHEKAVNTALVTLANLMLKQALLQDAFVRVRTSIIWWKLNQTLLSCHEAIIYVAVSVPSAQIKASHMSVWCREDCGRESDPICFLPIHWTWVDNIHDFDFFLLKSDFNSQKMTKRTCTSTGKFSCILIQTTLLISCLSLLVRSMSELAHCGLYFTLLAGQCILVFETTFQSSKQDTAPNKIFN